MNTPTTVVYVALLAEGVDCWRPATTETLGVGRCPLTGSVPEEEVWEFRPGEIVMCRERTFQNGVKGICDIDSVNEALRSLTAIIKRQRKAEQGHNEQRS
jgi:hypothetical protein